MPFSALRSSALAELMSSSSFLVAAFGAILSDFGVETGAAFGAIAAPGAGCMDWAKEGEASRPSASTAAVRETGLKKCIGSVLRDGVCNVPSERAIHGRAVALKCTPAKLRKLFCGILCVRLRARP